MSRLFGRIVCTVLGHKPFRWYDLWHLDSNANTSANWHATMQFGSCDRCHQAWTRTVQP